MKPYRISYYILAQKEILEQKVVSFLILTAVVLSTMMTTAVVQSAGMLTAMRRQQAVMLRGDYHATFVQLNEEKTRMLEADERFSYTGRSVPVGSTELNDLLRLDLVEYQGKSIETIPPIRNWWRGGCRRRRWRSHCQRMRLSFWDLMEKQGTGYLCLCQRRCGTALP